MKTAFLFASLVLSAPALADDHSHHAHHAAPEAVEAKLSGSSLYNLESSWRDASGKPVALSSLAGRPRLVAMLYTGCKTACPLLVQDMKTLRDKLPKKTQAKISLTVFSLDAQNDTPEHLAAFASKMSLGENWALLSPRGAGDVTEIASALGVQYKRLESGDYIHSNVIFLLNEKGEIVAKKEGLKTTSEDFSQKVREVAGG